MNSDLRTLYLDLMKNTLSYSFWPEPQDVTEDQRKNGMVWPVNAHTMIGLK